MNYITNSNTKLLAMKLTILFTLLLSIHATAGVLAQKVSIKVQNQPLWDVLLRLEEQSDYSFTVKEHVLKQAKPVSINVTDTETLEVLAMIFKEQPLLYQVKGKIINIHPKPVRKLSTNEPLTVEQTTEVQQTIDGTVSDENGQPLIGASVAIKGTNSQTITDSEGRYSLPYTPNAVIVVTYIGYEKQEINSNHANNIRLAKQTSTLDETIVIGYGATSRRLATGSVAKVTAKEIENQPVSNPLQALQGRAAGVLITNTNGVSGSNVNVQIRGRGSLTAGTEPLYIIDGVPFNNTPLFNDPNPQGAAGLISPFNSIVPADIESIEILKDADATAIYGSRGANGVVLVTTKQGKAGKTALDIQFSTGSGKTTRTPQMLNTAEYIQFRTEAYANDNVTPTIQDAYDLLEWDNTADHNWLKEYTGGTARNYEASASISGGNAQNQYLLRGNYRKDGTVYPSDWAYQRSGALLNTQHSSSNGRFKAHTSVNFTSDKNNQPFTDYTQVYLLPPHFPLYNTDGSLYWHSSADLMNPESFTLTSADNRARNLVANGSLSYSPLAALQLKVNGGYHDMRHDRIYTNPSAAQKPRINQGSYSFFGNSNQRTYIIEPQADYHARHHAHSIQALLGATWQYTIREGMQITGYDYATDALLRSLSAAGRTADQSNRFTENKFASLFARVNYRYQEKYIVNATYRTDGSSRFAPDRRWGSFYSIGAAWLFSNEKLLKEYLPILSFGKLRGSYGTTGNDQITDYQYLATYGSKGNYQGVSTLSPARIANPLYSWEVTKKLEAALELGFAADRILLTAQWYRNRSDSQLVDYTLPYYIGFTSYQANLPALIQNTGVELELQATLLQNKDFRWRIGANFTQPRNKLLKFPELESSTYRNKYIIGEPLDLQWGYRYLGVDPDTGRGLFEDVDQNSSINSTGDRQVIAKNLTKNFGGISSNLSYKNIELDIHLQYAKQTGYGINTTERAFGNQPFNISRSSFEDRWQNVGDQATHPRAAKVWATGSWAEGHSSLYMSSSALYQDASYLRLKNVNLSYRLPLSLTDSLRLQQCRVYFQGQNLLTFSPMKDLDPETQATQLSIPLAPLRMLTFGVQVTL